MNFVGIITEYDPFHNGHAAQLAMLRARGAQTIAVCMSSGAVQRGGVPLLPEPVRVQAALQAGADLVVALPGPYASAGAEDFAAAGVHLLGALGCDTLAFGAETPDAARLLEATRLLDQAALQPELRRRLAQGQTFAAARAAALQAVLPGGGELLRSPNNILGIEYCKALLRQKSNMQPCPLPRLGAGHGAQAPGRAGQIQIASASFLRAAVQKNGMAGMEAYVPCEAKELYRDAAARGLLLSPQRFSTALLALLRSRRAEELAAVRGCSEGIENRLRAAIRTADSAETLYGQMKTKRYPHARLRRLALDAALGVRAGALPPLPPFLHVLGARRAALGRLQQARLPASTSLARLERALPDQGEVFRLYQAFVDFSALCRETPQPMGLACTQKPVLL